jgi:hypothetical protein
MLNKINWKAVKKALGDDKKFILKQVCFWVEKFGHEFTEYPGKKFVANSVSQWYEQLKENGFTYGNLRKNLKELVDEGWLIREKMWVKSPKEACKNFALKTKNTKHHYWYAVNWELFENFSSSKANNILPANQTNNNKKAVREKCKEMMKLIQEILALNGEENNAAIVSSLAQKNQKENSKTKQKTNHFSNKSLS